MDKWRLLNNDLSLQCFLLKTFLLLPCVRCSSSHVTAVENKAKAGSESLCRLIDGAPRLGHRWVPSLCLSCWALTEDSSTYTGGGKAAGYWAVLQTSKLNHSFNPIFISPDQANSIDLHTEEKGSLLVPGALSAGCYQWLNSTQTLRALTWEGNPLFFFVSDSQVF